MHVDASIAIVRTVTLSFDTNPETPAVTRAKKIKEEMKSCLQRRL